MVSKYYGKPDSNQESIIQALRSINAIVVIVSRVPHFVDLVVGYRGKTYLLEIKEKGKELRKSQDKFFSEWTGDTLAIIRTPQEALELVCEKTQGF
jgi:hypothetical protein